MSGFAISLTNEQLEDPEVMLAFQDFMDAVAEEHEREVDRVMRDLDVSEGCVSDVVYLRTRSRHTPELEQRLIELYRAGTPPNIMEFD
jgi:hypothetical protein